MGEFCLLVEFRQEGSAPAAFAAGLFITLTNYKTFVSVTSNGIFYPRLNKFPLEDTRLSLVCPASVRTLLI